MVGGWRRAGGKTGRRVGLDIGEASIKLAELLIDAGGARLTRRLVQELPVGDPGSVDRVGWLQTALKEFDASALHVALAGPDVAIRRIDVPPMSARELREAVRWQVKDQVPFPVQDALLDFRVVGEVWEKDVRKQDVLVAAASRSTADAACELVQRAGGRVVSLTPSPLAACSAVSVLVPAAAQGTVAVMEIGASSTQMVIMKDGVVRAVRELANGGATMTDALVGVVALEHGERAIDRPLAESLKRRYGVLVENPEGSSEEGVPLFHVASLMRPSLESLLTEVARFLDFYKMQARDSSVQRLLLCGGGACLKGLSGFLRDGLGIPTEVFDPLGGLQAAPTVNVETLEPEGPRLAVAIGLALSPAGVLDLSPPEIRRAKAVQLAHRIKERGRLWSAIAAAVVSAALVAIGWGLDRAVASRQRVWDQIEPNYLQAMRVQAQAQTMEQAVTRLHGLQEREPVIDGLMKEIGRLVPASLELDALELSLGSEAGEYRLQLRGRMAASSAGSLSSFVDEMGRSAFFDGAELATSEMRGSGEDTRFEIEARLK